MISRSTTFVAFVAALLGMGLQAEPIRLHPANPHYYLFRGKPTVLVSSGDHWGGVINKEFDYTTYLNTLHEHGLNYVRLYPGYLWEPMGKWDNGNDLGVKPSRLSLPWARSEKPGYAFGGNLFDLDKWDSEYFQRLKDFVRKASERAIVVEICFFNAQYGDSWPMSPLYYQNNVQGEGKGDFEDAQTLKHPDLVRREEDYVRKITQEVNDFDNVVLEICDEPYLTGSPIQLAGAWVDHMIDVVKKTERLLPQKHLIAQQIEGPIGGPVDFTSDPRVSVIVTQYAWEGYREQMGGLKALDYRYDQNKPIDFNETDIYPPWYAGPDKVGDSRVEAWEFIVGGGGSFNQLNDEYTVQNPAGNTPDTEKIRKALQNLQKFISSFDFTKMHPDRNFVLGGVPLGVFGRSLSEPGKQYAFYHHHSVYGRGMASYKVTPGEYQEEFVVEMPAGTYQADWVDPASGSVVRSDKFTHGGGRRTLATPRHNIDIALRIERI